MKELLVTMVKALVDSPDKVKVKEVKGNGVTVIFQITAMKEDYRFIIGKGGRIIEAIRNIVTAAAFKTGTKVLIEVMAD